MTLPLVDDPSIADLVDDTGTGQDGTVVDKAVFEAIATAIDDALIATGETQTPGETTTEVIEARGNMASLDARISGVINDDGEFIGVDQSETLISQNQPQNLVQNDDFLVWPDGDTAAPARYVLRGTGTYSIQRCGDGLADITRFETAMCARVTTNATAFLSQVLFNSSQYRGSSGQNYFSGGCWVQANVSGAVHISLTCGVNVIDSGMLTDINTPKWFSFSGSIAGALSISGPNDITLKVSIDSPGIVYVSQITCILSSVAPSDWIPCIKEYHQETLVLDDGATAFLRTFMAMGRDALVLSALAHAYSGWPSPSTLRIQVYQEVSAGTNALFSTELGASLAGISPRCFEQLTPDTTYRWRCFSRSSASSYFGIRVQVTATDAAVTGKVAVDIRFMTYAQMFTP